MFRGLYAAATALDAAQQAHAVTADNLANSSTPGYRQRGVRFETFDRLLGRDVPPTGDIVGTQLVSTFTDFKPGPLQYTANPLDLSLSEPDQFFVVQGPNGPMYTRDGAFRIAVDGRVLTQAGYPLLAEGGPVQVPAGTTRLNFTSDGSIQADGVPTGRLQVARFANPTQLKAVGPVHFTAPEGVTPETAAPRVQQGYREASNVNAPHAMVGMIASTRYYEAAQRALRTISESVQLNTRPS
ncbi:MAG: flagellar hook basal-body protein [Fimbriiglobus sp.]|jgi:flagellar basal-body rod protein FlgF/flagellar basal-body rod protein FlgG|nr:flagellar hook basal-body protein [Fimbriiglobus sp.]